MQAIIDAHDRAFAMFREASTDVALANDKARHARTLLTDVEDELHDALRRHDDAITAIIAANQEALALLNEAL
jgi:hypothetical protein